MALAIQSGEAPERGFESRPVEYAEARVGQLLEQVAEMSDRQDKMADWLKKKVPAATAN